jgi:hypothetical protein
MKCFDHVKNFCQFRKELLNNQAILYQVFSTEEDRLMRDTRHEENFIDISQAVKIKLEVTENDSFNSNEMHFESEATMHGDANDHVPYHFKMEGHNADMGIYSEFDLRKFVYISDNKPKFRHFRCLESVCRCSNNRRTGQCQNHPEKKTAKSFG